MHSRTISCGCRRSHGHPHSVCDPWSPAGRPHYYSGEASGGGFGLGPFGVRRPLRFLAYKLQLEEAQVTELARTLNELKIERAQAAVDDRRTLTAFADSVASDNFDETKASEAAALRVRSTEQLQRSVIQALGRIHALLTAEQRARLAYLIRTGTLTL